MPWQRWTETGWSLVLRVRRSVKGEIFVMWPIDEPGARPKWEKKWDPHVSYHADGRLHHKSHDRVQGRPRYGSKPGPAFSGTQPIITTPISQRWVRAVRAINKPWDPSEFADVFQIRIELLDPEQYAVGLSVDVVAPGVDPLKNPGRIVARHTFDVLGSLHEWRSPIYRSSKPASGKRRASMSCSVSRKPSASR